MTVWRSIGRTALVSFSLALAGYLVWAAQRSATTTPAAEPAPVVVPALAASTPGATDALASPVTDPSFAGTSESLAPDDFEAMPAAESGHPAFLFSSKSMGWNPVPTPPPILLPAAKEPVFLPSSKFGPLDPVPGQAATVPAEPAPVFLPSSKSRAPAGPRPELPKATAPPKPDAPGGKP